MKQSLDQGGPKERTDAPNEASAKRNIAIERGKFKVCSGKIRRTGAVFASGKTGEAVADIPSILRGIGAMRTKFLLKITLRSKEVLIIIK